MKNSSIASLAILKVNWDRLGKDYIENFVPFVAEALRNSPDDVVSLPDLQSDIKESFGLDLPLNPLRQLLNRAVKHGLIRRESGVYYREPHALQDNGFEDARNLVIGLYDRIIRRLIEYASSKHASQWTEEQANQAVHAFLGEYALEMLYSRAERTPVPLDGAPKNAVYVVGTFLNDFRETDSQVVEDFAVLVKGYLLANAMYLPEPARVAQRFKNTRIYLDSSIIIYALGYAGRERQAPCEELLNLARDYGADLRCFQATLDEIRRILDACATRFRNGNLQDAYGPTIEWFIESKKTSSDIELMIARLPLKIRSFGVAIEDMPAHIHEFQVDEAGFENALQKAIGYSNPRARVHDVDCVAATAQLRRGRNAFDIEQCGALFVTTNFDLARTSRAFLQPDAPEGAVALCVTDSALGNLLWLKNPMRAPDLPEKLLLADAFAAMQPPEPLWKAYLAEAARLKESGEITEDEYYALRYSLTAKRSLMDLTEGDLSAFSEGTVADVLKVAKENIRSDLQAELSAEQRLRAAVESSLAELEHRQANVQDRVEKRADRIAIVAALFVCIVLSVALSVGAFFSFPWTSPLTSASPYAYAVTSVLVAFFVYTIASMIWGTSIVSLYGLLKKLLKKPISRWLRTLLS